MTPEKSSPCTVCRAPVIDGDRGSGPEGCACCEACESKYPHSLLKAVVDDFHYSLQLRTGVVIKFSRAYIKGEFVHLTFDELYAKHLPFPFHPAKVDKRGVDVRLSDIVWCADGKTLFEDGQGEAASIK
jgi:hypothetical protein